MGARIRVLLNPEEDRTLFELRTATTVTQRIKDRAEALRLSAHGWYALEDCCLPQLGSPNCTRDDSSLEHLWFGGTMGGPRKGRETQVAGGRHDLRAKNASSLNHEPITATNSPKS
jgi:hypothetical protein